MSARPIPSYLVKRAASLLVEQDAEWMARSVDISPPTPDRFTLIDDAELGELPRPEWIIGTVIPANALVVVVAPPKSLKSFLALDWAFHIAAGMDWHGQPTQRGEVCYVYAEGTTGLQGRVAALKSYYGVSGKVGILFLPRRVLINEAADATALVEAIKAKCEDWPRLIIIDTLARNMSGDENSQEAMSAFVRGCDLLREETGASVVVVHHTGYAADGRGRGSSVLPAAADTHIQCSRDGDRIQLECKFQKDAPEFGILSLEAMPVGSSLVLKPVGVNSGQLTGNRLLTLAALQDNHADEGAKYTTWMKTTGLTNGPFSTCLSWLKANAYVKVGHGGKYKVTDAGRQALTPRSNVTPAPLHIVGSTPLHRVGVSNTPRVEQERELREETEAV